MPPPTHLTPWRTFSIFISSTFLDMQAERDHLKNIVFPKIEEELNQKRIRLEIVDLRWGVNTDNIVDEGEREKEVLKVVLDEIKRCRPFFIGLLGDRYGWVPPEERMKAVLEKEGLSIQNKDKSVTALEIEFGVLASKEQLDRSVFYFREPLDYIQMSANKAARYSDAHDPELSADEKALRIKALDDLKSTIKDHFEKQNQSDKVKSYRAGWDTDIEKVTGLESWGEIVKKDILQECARHAQDTWDLVPQNWIEEERFLLDKFVDWHAYFSTLRRESFWTRFEAVLSEEEIAELINGSEQKIKYSIEKIPRFSGRDVLLSDLKNHLLDHKPEQWGLMLIGEGGTGKSAVFSQLYNMMQKEDCLVLAHSAGLSVRSKKVFCLLEKWNQQLAGFLDIKEALDFDIETEQAQSIANPDELLKTPLENIEKLQARFRERLFAAANKTKVILLIDALDRFEPTAKALYLSWLPDVMHYNVRMVCTAISGTEKKAIEYHKGLSVYSIDHFSPEEALFMLETLCKQAHKTLPDQIKKVILDKSIDADRLACSNPLWLSLAANILMVMDQDDFEKINQNRSNEIQAMAKYMEAMAEKFPPLPGPLFIDLINKAGNVFGKEFTIAVFDFTACSRHGLREKDLEVLLPDMGLTWDPLVFANIRRWFGSHFVIQGEDQQWDLAHSILRAALLGHADDQQKRDILILTANHLLELDRDPLKSNEIMYHLLQAGMKEEAARYYGSKLTVEEIAGSTNILAETIISEKNGIDAVISIPSMIVNDDQLFSELSHNYIFELNALLETEGNLNLRLSLLQELKDKFENFEFKYRARLPNDDDSLKFNYVSLIEKLGGIYQDFGQFEQALEYFEKVQQLTKELYEANPKNESIKSNLRISYKNIGNLHKVLGQFDLALEYFERVQQLTKELYEANPKNESLKSDLAISYQSLGEIHQELGQLNLALEYFKKVQQLTKELYEANPKNESIKKNMVNSFSKLGDTHQALGQFEQALEYFELRFLIDEESYKADPKNENIKKDLSISYAKMGDINQVLGRLYESLEYYKKVQQLSKELFEANPQSKRLKDNLLNSYSKLGDAHQVLGQFEQAIPYFESVLEALKQYLKPILPYSRINTLLRKGFFGRTWLVDSIEHWRINTNGESCIFCIVGSPGIGKSAFVAHLARNYGEIVAVHFCEYNKSDHNDVRRIVRNIVYQLATRFPDFRNLLLNLPEIADLDRKNPTELFEYLLVNPLRSVINSVRNRNLIVIDALNEANEGERNPIVEMLVGNAHRLPKWLGIVVTYRHENQITIQLQKLNPFIISMETESNRIDIRGYLRQELALPLQNRFGFDQIVERILENSGDVFLYVEIFCDEVQNGSISLDNADQVPQGIEKIFNKYFQQQFPDLEKFRNDVRPALGVILAAREPLRVDFLRRLLNWDHVAFLNFITTIKLMFPITKEGDYEVIKPLQKSYYDWLADETKAGPYFVSLVEGNRLLANFFFSFGLPLLEKNEVALKFLPFHASAANENGLWIEAMTDFGFLQALVEYVDVTEGKDISDNKIPWCEGYFIVLDEIRRWLSLKSSLKDTTELIEQLNSVWERHSDFVKSAKYIMPTLYCELKALENSPPKEVVDRINRRIILQYGPLWTWCEREREKYEDPKSPWSDFVARPKIFISYRREGGEHFAGRVKDFLKNKGFSVFMDVEDLKSGPFDETLLGIIENVIDVIVILSPGCLERCINDEDWFRREIAYAIKCNRNLVPILVRGFQMPRYQDLPHDIAKLPKYHGLSPTHELFEKSMERLIMTFLKADKVTL